MDEVRDLFARGSALIGGRIEHLAYILLSPKGEPCRACVNGCIALGYLQARHDGTRPGDLLLGRELEAEVPVLRTVVGQHATFVCPVCQKLHACFPWRARTGDLTPPVTLRMLVDHLYEDHMLPPHSVLAYVEDVLRAAPAGADHVAVGVTPAV